MTEPAAEPATTERAAEAASAQPAEPPGHPAAPEAEGSGATRVVADADSVHAARAVPARHRAHPSDAQYMLIALILAVITAIEVGVSYAKGLGDAAAPLLLILAATKFAIVVGFFMHLRFDSVILRRVFATGIALAIAIYLITFFMLGVFTSAHGVHS